mmetsp:Transcript_62796/g.147277  ORF Transcript_62796/g.147277 Transcript_62796/m.147277 type:complete len:149 (+) Transcript_62796:159-605(+)
MVLRHSAGERPLDNKYANFVTVASAVMSWPGITPRSAKARPTAYFSSSTLPWMHCEQATTTIPASTSFEQAAKKTRLPCWCVATTVEQKNDALDVFCRGDAIEKGIRKAWNHADNDHIRHRHQMHSESALGRIAEMTVMNFHLGSHNR